MKPGRGLGRQIILAMVSTSLATVGLSVAGMYLFYAVLFYLSPDLLSNETSWWPSSAEWLAIAVIGAIGAAIATRAAIRLSRRIVMPLNSVATSVQQIAHGDLSARAFADARTPGEAAALVNDFNRMATNLEKASAGVAHWNAMIAHELRTPVTILRGRLQGLADGVFEPDSALFRSLQIQAEGLARLIDDLRTVSLTDGGHLHLEYSQVDLAAEVRAVVDLMTPGLETAGFILSISLQSGLAEVDPARMRQAVMALLDNAEKHAQPGILSVTLLLNEEEAELNVCDQGPGLDPALAEDIFVPFRRYVSPEDNKPSGSGLGLAVVRAIAKAHNGSATYRNDSGGSCFCVCLPRHPK